MANNTNKQPTNDKGWNDIAEKFEKSIDKMTASGNYHCQIIEWLKQNYNVPTKK